MELLRDRDWCDNLDVQVGGYVDIDLPEMGAVGSALVTGIDLHPEIESGEGSLVTARFEHTSGHIYELKLASEEKPIGVTGTHPVCSIDRNDWVSVADLEIDEEVKTLNSITTVESVEKTDRVETVYNIEVEGEHVYRVGESGLLVHNVSVRKLAKNYCMELREDLEAVPDKYLDDDSDPKVSAAVHTPTGKHATGVSTGGVPSNLHQLIVEDVRSLENHVAEYGGPCKHPPGVCAEVDAVNNLLWKMGDDAELCGIEVATLDLENCEPVKVCQYCRRILQGVKFPPG